MQFDKHLFHYSATGIEEAVRTLLQRGVTVDEKNRFLETALVCADFNKPNMVKLLLDAGADVNAANSDLQRPLHLAVIKNSLESVKLLIQAKADVHVEDKYQKIPINYAVQYGFIDIVKALLEFTHPRFGISNLNIAVELSNEEIVKLILERSVNVNGETPNGNYPLFLASYQPNLNITRLLLDYGANVDKRQNEYGYTPLHQAARMGFIEQVQLLIERGANVCAKDFEEETPLHYAASTFRENTYDIIKLLIQHGANCNDLTNSQISPLDYTLITCNREINEFLLERGANFSSKALYRAVLNSHIDVIELVLDNGFDVNASYPNGVTALHIAIQIESVEACELLLNRGADINKKSLILETPIHCIFNARSDYPRPKDERIKNLLVEHMAKLKFQNIPIAEQNEETIKSYPEWEEYYMLCIKELCEIEKYQILEDFSLFQLLFQNENKFVGYAKNEELVCAYESLTAELLKNFPIYFTDNFRKNFEKQIIKERQIKKTIIKLCNVFHTNFDVSKNIVKYLKVENLDFLNKL